jgi:hypothetical protein
MKGASALKLYNKAYIMIWFHYVSDTNTSGLKPTSSGSYHNPGINSGVSEVLIMKSDPCRTDVTNSTTSSGLFIMGKNLTDPYMTNFDIDSRQFIISEELRSIDLTNPGIHAGVDIIPLNPWALALQLLKQLNMNHQPVHYKGLYRINSGINESGSMKTRLSDKIIIKPGTVMNSLNMRKKLIGKDLLNPGIHDGVDIIPPIHGL